VTSPDLEMICFNIIVTFVNIAAFLANVIDFSVEKFHRGAIANQDLSDCNRSKGLSVKQSAYRLHPWCQPSSRMVKFNKLNLTKDI
jgi:hypothetical protein